LILITHDRSFMDSVTTHTMGIHRKKIKKNSGSTDKYYDQILKQEEIYEKTRINDDKKRKEVERFIDRFRAKARLAGLVQSRIKTLQKRDVNKKLEKIPTLEFSFKSEPFNPKWMMDVTDLSFSYGTDLPNIIERLNITIVRNDRIGVIGKNGQGKTTFLKLLSSQLTPVDGQVKCHSTLKVGYFEQTNVLQLDPDKSVVDEILSSNVQCSPQLARNISGSLMFEGDMALKKISILSGGEKSRVLLGKILVTPCHMLLLDEPTNHLDIESTDSMLAAIDSFDGSVVIVTHNELFLRTLTNRLVVFDGRKVFIFEGNYQTFLDEVGWKRNGMDSKDVFRIDLLEGKNEGKKIDKKILRKIRAEKIQQRSIELNPLEDQITSLEKSIKELENELVENNQQLVNASEKGDGESIVRLAKRNNEIGPLLEKYYVKLNKITKIYENKVEEYKRSISDL